MTSVYDLESIWSTQKARDGALRFYCGCLNNIYTFIAFFLIFLYLINLRINNVKVISK